MDSLDTLTGLTMDVMVQRLRDVALYAHLHRIALENLTTDHLNIFHRALLRVLGSELAIDTFAHIVDGLPIADVAWDMSHPGISGDDHPIEAHPSLCPRVKDKTSACLEQYDLHSLASTTTSRKNSWATCWPRRETRAVRFPILPHKGNRTRADRATAHTHKLIFREYWDRKPATQQLLDFLERWPQNELDYPEFRDFMNHLNALESEWKEAEGNDSRK